MLVILKRDYGQLGNRLHTSSNLLAWCLENGHSYVNLSFQDYVNGYKLLRNHPIDKILLKNFILYKILRNKFIISFVNRLVLSDKWLIYLKNWVFVIDRSDNETISEHELNNSPKKAVLIIRAWDIRCPNSIISQQDIIRKIFTPLDNIISKIKEIKANLPEHDFLVGLHARRGDYVSWENGKYYFSWKHYYKWLLEVHNILSKTKGVISFVICSDENPPSELFEDLNPYISKLGPNFDLHLLSICDLQLGPPSSFGSWAQFYGKNQRICLNSSEMVITDCLAK